MTFPFISTQTGFFKKSTGSSLLAHENSLRNSLTLLRVGDSGRARNTLSSVWIVFTHAPLFILPPSKPTLRKGSEMYQSFTLWD